MTDLDGKTAVITGGASGIGFALAEALARRGCKVAILDVEAMALEAAVRRLNRDGSNLDVRGFLSDVTSRQSMEDAAKTVSEAFGPVHLVFANAGVGGVPGPIGQVSPKDWQWVLNVNLMGMIQTVDAFLPLLKEHGQAAHLVYTASMAGMMAPANMGPYAASKFATVAMAESLAAELEGSPINVSVLCPGFVSTRIYESERNRPGDLASAPKAQDDMISAMVKGLVTGGMSADLAAERTLEAIAAKEFYIFTHPDMRGAVEQRFARINAGFDAAERSSALGSRP